MPQIGWLKEPTDVPTCGYAKAAPRTPADIGRDIAAAEQRIRDLKAELTSVPPCELVLEAGQIHNREPHLRRVEFFSHDQTSPRISVTRYEDTGKAVHAGTHLPASAIPRLKAWLNHYYPEVPA